MEIRFNVIGAERKALVEAIGNISGWAPVYKKAPTFAYAVENYTIDKDGTLSFDERVDEADVRSLLTTLTARGFVFDNPYGDAAGDEVSQDTKDGTEDSAGVAAEEDSDAPDRFSIEVPVDGFTSTALSNLEKIVDSKSALIRKAIDAEALPIFRDGDRLCFPWFSAESSAGEVDAYSKFIHTLCEMAKRQQRVTAKENLVSSEKFAFRCFLLRLGFIGAEYAAARKILLSKLTGDGSFKNGKRKKQSVAVSPSGKDYHLAEAMADAELMHNANALFEADQLFGR